MQRFEGAQPRPGARVDIGVHGSNILGVRKTRVCGYTRNTSDDHGSGYTSVRYIRRPEYSGTAVWNTLGYIYEANDVDVHETRDTDRTSSLSGPGVTGSGRP